MNREIKFRVWDTFNKRMVYDPYRFEPMQQYQKDTYEWVGDSIYYEDWQDVDDGIDRPCFIMQYTGLKDKNGKEVYKGDILAVWGGDKLDDSEYKTDIISVVEFDKYELGYTINTPHGDECKLTSGNIYQLEVIGNIYENPELIEK